jgi:hypothetical protein
MQLSPRTVKILKNWTEIADGLIIRPGQAQATMAQDKSIFAKTTFEEDFPRLCGIVKLSEFVNTLDMFKEPEIAFEDKAVYTRSENMNLKYVYCEPGIVLPNYDKYGPDRMKFPAETIEIPVTADEFSRLRRGMKFWDLPDLVIQWDGSKLQIIGTDIKVESSNRVVLTVVPNGPVAHEFAAAFPASNFHKLFDGNYIIRIAIDALKIGQFDSTDQKVQYFIGATALKSPLMLKED